MISLRHLFFAILILVVAASCRPTQEITADDQPDVEEETEITPATSTILSADDLRRYRSSLSDQTLRVENSIVDVFKLTEEDLRTLDTNAGYRIQIHSTDDMAEADSVSLAYYDWAMERDLGYDRLPEAHITFRQPSYRVRIGDFRSRSRAIEFLNVIRPHFQGAWIVMDTIDPDLAM